MSLRLLVVSDYMEGNDKKRSRSEQFKEVKRGTVYYVILYDLADVLLAKQRIDVVASRNTTVDTGSCCPP